MTDSVKPSDEPSNAAQTLNILHERGCGEDENVPDQKKTTKKKPPITKRILNRSYICGCCCETHLRLKLFLCPFLIIGVKSGATNSLKMKSQT